MPVRKQFGAFGGVFTPSLLTILGVIMYLRLGWVVGSAGLIGALAIIVIAHIISVSTGLSISSIATDKKVGAGGVYYVLSRSLGLPIGGAIGLTLFVGTAFSIALYLIGFSESFNAYVGLGTGIHDIRISGSIALLILTTIAFISTSVAIKTQYFIMAAIAISLLSVFVGAGSGNSFQVPFFGSSDSASLDIVFAIFFPAVTGFTAGIAMSGDLKNPKKAIPRGTIAAISVGFLVYVGLAVFLATTVSPEELKSDYNILMKIALFAPAVVAGIWGATLSSAMGGILGGPRILQALSNDKVTPVIFGKGYGNNLEPRNALILAVLIAEAGILIGELDIIARLVSMFYLAAYGFINLSFFLESWAGSDFKPSFKVSKWIGLIGFVTTFTVMFKLDFLAMIAAFLVIGGIYVWLSRKQIALGTGDIWQSVWQTVIKSGLKRMEATEEHKRNWKPNIMLFSGNSEARPYLLEFSKALAGQMGMVTNFDLVENKEAKVLFPKHKQSVSDELLDQYGIFGRQVEVSNVFKGIETIATTFGFSGLDPNTVLMGWARNTKDPIWFAQMTRKLIDLDYNVLYLDYDQRWGFRKKSLIDLWWRGISNNAELMLHLAKFIQSSPDWRSALIRILLVNDYNVDRRVIESRIRFLLDEFRVKAEIVVINNEVERRPFYDLMKIMSADSDLIFIGIPDIKKGDEETFVARTNELVNIIGTTLLVKASSTFEVSRLGIRDMGVASDGKVNIEDDLEDLKRSGIPLFDDVLKTIDMERKDAASMFRGNTLSVISQHYGQFRKEIESTITDLFKNLQKSGTEEAEAKINQYIGKLLSCSLKFRGEEITALSTILSEGLQAYMDECSRIIDNSPRYLRIPIQDDGKERTRKLALRKALAFYQKAYGDYGLQSALQKLGGLCAEFVVGYEQLTRSIALRIAKVMHGNQEQIPSHISKIRREVNNELLKLKTMEEKLQFIPLHALRQADRKALKDLSERGVTKRYGRSIAKLNRSINSKQIKSNQLWIRDFHEFWTRNQRLFLHRFETDMRLSNSLSRLQSIQWYLRSKLREILMVPLTAKIDSLLSALEGFDPRKMSKNHSSVFNIEEESLDIGQVMQAILDRIRNVNAELQDEIELIAEESVQNITEIQGGGVRTVKLSLMKITDYLVLTNYEVPLQEKANSLTSQMRAHGSEIYNTAELLGSMLDEALSENDHSHIESFIVKARETLLHRRDAIQTNFLGFETEISEKLDTTSSALQIGNITGHSDELSQYIKRIGQRKGVKAHVIHLGEIFLEWKRQLFDFIDLKSDNVARSRFDLKQAEVRSDQEVLRGIVSRFTISKTTATMLPYYYKQLFSGKHLNLGKAPEFRSREISEVKSALLDIENGMTGAILICGSTLNGKSYLADYISRHMLSSSVYRMIAPAGGALTKAEFQRSFQVATGRKGNPVSILKSLQENSTILIDDLELWWTKAERGSEIINHLCDLIGQFGQSHRFILTMNIHVLEMIRHSTRLDNAITTLIHTGASGLRDMSKEIWTRHSTGVANISYRDFDAGSLSESLIRKWVRHTFNASSGRMGYGLQLWITNLESEDEDKMILHNPRIPAFPFLKDQSLYYILLQFYLHRSLSRQRMGRIFRTSDPNWFNEALNLLLKSNIVESPVKDVFQLKATVRPYMEDWLNERGML